MKFQIFLTIKAQGDSRGVASPWYFDLQNRTAKVGLKDSELVG
jgi:hypothetical protein